MADHKRRIGRAVLNQFEQRPEILTHVGLAHLERQALRDRRL